MNTIANNPVDVETQLQLENPTRNMEEDICEEGMMVVLEQFLTEKKKTRLWRKSGGQCACLFLFTPDSLFLLLIRYCRTRQDGSSLAFCLNFVRISCYFFLD